MRARVVSALIALATAIACGCGAILGLGDAPEFDLDAGADVAQPNGDDEAATDAMTADAADGADAPPCVPKTCAELDAACGSAPNACGGAIPDCGVCTPPDTCGAGGPNHCGDAGCIPKSACTVDQCGTVSNGCGGTLGCPGCSGARYCNVAAGACEACSVFSTSCAPSSTNVCPGGGTPPGKLYACSSPPTDPQCVHCPNPTTGQGELYCCP